MSTPTWRWSACAAADAVSAGAISAVELARDALRRLEAVNPRLNAVVTMDADKTVRQAAAVDARVARGEHLPLAGVPVTIKDNLWVQGWRIAQGSKLFADFVAPQDAWPVARMKALGAVIVGITNSAEFACKGLTDNLLFGTTRSPWDLARTPGGSSGGAAAATAAGIAALALVTDSGGSTRRPAAHCGLVGMKPSFGVVPYGPGFDEPNFGQSVIGQLARDVGDVALLFDQLVGFDPHDWASQRVALPSARAAITQPPERTLRIAWTHDLGLDYAIEPAVRARLEATVETLRSDGYRVEVASPGWPEAMRAPPLNKLQFAGLTALYGAAYDADPARIDPDMGAQIVAGRGHDAVEIAQALLVRERAHAALARFFDDWDILLCPTAPVVSWPLDGPPPAQIGGRAVGTRGHAMFTPPFNYCQAPACSVPAGLVDGLPVGLQIVGPRYADARVLQLAAHVERLCGPAPHPALWDED